MKKRQINAFEVDGQYLFKRYFPPDIYDELRSFYNSEEYRFEVPIEDMPQVERFLKANRYELVLIEDIEGYCVVKPKSEDQPEHLFKRSVLRRSMRYHHVYLLEDQAAVEEAVYHGAERLVDSELGDVF